MVLVAVVVEIMYGININSSSSSRVVLERNDVCRGSVSVKRIAEVSVKIACDVEYD